ncbi:MAG TPA: hypothetical protein VJR89_42530, partial [Polyangiales bacterium]|nr:hypothetical protein [Polyangiales bacterium]
RLQFDQSLDVPLIEEDVRADLALSTAEPGAAYDPQSGELALAASGTLEAIGAGINPLDGFGVDVVITGALDPKP